MPNKATAVIQWIRREAGPLLVASIFPLLLIVYFFKEGFSIKVLALFLALPLVVYLSLSVAIWLWFVVRNRDSR